MSDDGDDVRALLARIEKARRHARRLTDARTIKSLNDLADELENQVAALRAGRKPDDHPVIPDQAVEAPMGEPHMGPELMAAMKPAEPEPDENSTEPPPPTDS